MEVTDDAVLAGLHPEYTYEAHITKADGTRATVLLDANFTVTETQDQGQGGPGGGGHGGPNDGGSGGSATDGSASNG